MLTPFLIVSYGRAGSWAIRSLREDLINKLKIAGWPHNRLPASWQLLEITIGRLGWQRDSFTSLMPAEDALHLVNNSGHNDEVYLPVVDNISELLLNRVSSKERLSTFGGWGSWMEPHRVAIDRLLGERPTNERESRALDRARGLVIHSKIASTISSKHNKLQSSESSYELSQVSELLGQNSSGSTSQPIAIVIGSASENSGLLLDLVETINAISSSYVKNTHAFLFLEEPKSMNWPSVLATSAEVMAGICSNRPSESTSNIFKTFGLDISERTGFGAKYNYLIGHPQSAEKSSREAIKYFRAIGHSLSFLMTNQDTVSDFEFLHRRSSIDLSNKLNVIDLPVLDIFRGQNTHELISATGNARISLGLVNFTNYLAEGCSKLVLERLLWPTFQNFKFSDMDFLKNLIEEKTSLRVESFWSKTGLDLKGTLDNLLNLLKPNDETKYSESILDTILEKIKSDFRLAAKSVDERIQKVSQEFVQIQQKFQVEHSNFLYVLAQNWTSVIQDKIVFLISRTVAQEGLLVTLNLIKQVREKVAAVANQELPVIAQSKLSQLSSISTVFVKKLSIIDPTSLSASQADELNKLIQVSVNAIIDNIRMNLVAEIYNDLNLNFLASLEKTIEEAELELSDKVKRDVEFYSNLIDFETNLIPEKFESNNFEKLIIPTKTYPRKAQDLIKDSLPQQYRDKWLEILTQRVILGSQLAAQGENELFDLFLVRKKWNPQKKEIRKNGDQVQIAEIDLIADPLHYLDRCKKWLLSSTLANSPLGDYLKQDLPTYINSGDEDTINERKLLFIDAFSESIQASTPLVKINATLAKLVHPQIDISSRFLNISTIPFTSTGNSRDIYEGCKSLLEEFGFLNNDIEKKFRATPGIQDIDFFSTFQNPLQPIVIDSIMKPCYEIWNKCKDDASLREGFWTERRSRPLTEFIPLSPHVLQRMILGWFISYLLGQRDLTDDKQRGPKIRIWIDEEQLFCSLPHPLLPLKNSLELLPTVLESFVLVMPECSNTSSLTPMKPYLRLLELGEIYPSLMADWIRNARLEEAAPCPIAEVAGDKNGGPDNRREKLLETVKSIKKIYLDACKLDEDKNNPADVSKTYEIKEQIIFALDEINNFIGELKIN